MIKEITTYQIYCDRCVATNGAMPTYDFSLLGARAKGWDIQPYKHCCPDCTAKQNLTELPKENEDDYNPF